MSKEEKTSEEVLTSCLHAHGMMILLRFVMQSKQKDSDADKFTDEMNEEAKDTVERMITDLEKYGYKIVAINK